MCVEGEKSEKEKGREALRLSQVSVSTSAFSCKQPAGQRCRAVG